jgi:hypothetical protein
MEPISIRYRMTEPEFMGGSWRIETASNHFIDISFQILYEKNQII